MATLADECVERVAGTLRAYAMLRQDEKALVAVSGGPDSMCLLHLLLELGYPVEVAYLDHQTRGGDSAADGAFVRDHAGVLGLRYHTERRPVEKEAGQAGLGFEEYARKVRYAFLRQAALDGGCRVIATGHTADDNAETILMRVLRGTTVRGLAGIPPIRCEGDLGVVRPLIDCSREQVLAYLDAHGIPYRADRSNTNLDYTRNRVRHELLPLLRDGYNPRVAEALTRLGEAARCENDLMTGLADVAYRECVIDDRAVDRQRFNGIHRALQRRIVLELARRCGVDCPFERVDGAAAFIAEAASGQAFDLGGGVCLRNGRERTEIVSSRPEIDPREVALNVPGVTVAFGKRFEVAYRQDAPTEDLSGYCSPARQVFDADALGTVLAMRRRRPGDRFTPLGMTGSKKVNDYFTDCGIPATQRDNEILLVAGDEIAWIVGRAVAAPVAVTPNTRHLIEVQVSDVAQ